MKVVSFLGSPNKHGNTAMLLRKVLEGICGNENIEDKIVFLEEQNINPCMGCDACKQNEQLSCVMKDDMQHIYKKLKDSELIIIASPIYWWSVTAQTKCFIDRLYGINFKDSDLHLENKKVMLVMTYGGELPNSGPERVELNFREICEYIGVSVADVLGVCTGSVQVKDNEKALRKAYELGKKFNC